MRCSAETKRGLQCKNQALPESELCRVHAAAHTNGHAQATPSVAAAPATVAGMTAKKVATPQPRSRVDYAATEAEPDPFHAIAEAMSRAADQMQVSGEEPDVLAAEEQADEQDGLLSKAVYSTSYCVGYGVAFPTFLALGMLPMNNAFGRGLSDGVNSAKQSVREREESRAARKASQRPASGNAPQPDAG